MSQQLDQVNKNMSQQFTDLTTQQQNMHMQMSELTKMLAQNQQNKENNQVAAQRLG